MSWKLFKPFRRFFMGGFMWVLTKEYQEHLKKNEAYQFIINHSCPDFKELEKLEDT